MNSKINKERNLSKDLFKIAFASQLPTYSNILMCLDLVINHDINEKQKELIKRIFTRATIICNDYYKEIKRKEPRRQWYID
jgi:hypothetical protein